MQIELNDYTTVLNIPFSLYPQFMRVCCLFIVNYQLTRSIEKRQWQGITSILILTTLLGCLLIRCMDPKGLLVY